jgi:hypothetical protein
MCNPQLKPMTKISVAITTVVLGICSCGPGLGQDPDNGPDGGHNSGSDGTSSPTETKAGFFTISSSRYTVGTTMVEQGYATGTMYRIPPVSSSGGGCTTAKYGACDVQTCVASTTTTDGGLSITYADSGPVRISGVQVNDGTMTLSPGGYGYVTVSGAIALFNGGDTVRWVAPGNPSGAPGFDVSLVAPTAVQVIAPAFVQGKVTASATQDLAVTWSGSSTTTVTAQLAAGASGESVVARCSFTGSSGVVPAAAIAAVRSAGGSASIMIMMESRATRNPVGWDIAFALQTYGLVSSGISIGTLELQ